MAQKQGGAEISVPQGYHLVTFDQIDSTNEEARRQAAEGAAGGTWILASSQSKGRGRRGRSWISEPGNLYASLILRPDASLAQAAQLSFVTSLAVHDALAALLPHGAVVRCKWPNDVLLGAKKVSGILLESSSQGGNSHATPKPDWVIIGIGINIAHFPEHMEFPATSVKASGYSEIAVAALFQSVASFMDSWLDVWRTQGFVAIRNAWKERAAGLGHSILVRLENETLKGIFKDLGEGGDLLLALDRGEVKSVSAGDVFFHAPEGS